jgi:hypothetical protein
MGRLERIELRTIKEDKCGSQKNNGSRIFAKEIVHKHGLSANLTGCISKSIEKHPELFEYVDSLIATLIEYGKKTGMDHDQINRLLAYFIGHDIIPIREQLIKKIDEWEKKGAEKSEILAYPEVLRTDVTDELINVISLLLRKANVEPTPKEVSKYISLGISLDFKVLIKKIGICLAVGASANEILENFRLLKENVSVEMLYAATFESAMRRDIEGEHIPGSLPSGENIIDLNDLYEVIKLEEKEIKLVGKMDLTRKKLTDRYVYGPKAAFSATYRARTYLEIDKSK